MKKTALIIFLMIICAILLSSCALMATNGTGAVECSICVDKNKDGKCDRCGKTVEKKTHDECLDSDNDGECDECGESVEPEEEPEDEPVEEPSDDPCAECVDSDENGKCDECGESVEPSEEPIPESSLSLIKDGKIKFSIVTAEDLSGNVFMRISRLENDLSTLGYEVDISDESTAESTDVIEVLIGKISSRGDKFLVDGWDYGFTGYAVREIDGKIVISAGSDSAFTKAIDYFSEEILGIKENATGIASAEFKKSDEIIQYTEYRITSLKIAGRDLDGYVIAYDPSDLDATRLAREYRNKLFQFAGYNLPLADINSVDDKYISISHAPRSGGEGFEVRINGKNLEITSEYRCKTSLAGAAYITRLASASGDVDLAEFTYNTRDVYYEDFGAVGDGYTDDFEAIRDTHTHANECGHTVVARDDAQYYMGPSKRYVNATTDVVWGDATFIVDDRNIDPTDKTYNINIFYFTSTLGRITLTPENCEVIKQINENGGIDAETVTKLDLGLGYPAMLEVYNKNHKVYIRTHLVNEGNDQYELIEIDAEGNIDPDTRFLLDYEEITSIVVRRLEDAPITIDGGHFITRVPQLSEHCQTYMSRGIVLARANVTVKNFSHVVTDENDDAGCPYGGFLSMQRGAYNIVVDSCSFMSHKTYNVINKDGVKTNMGTYDISIQSSNNILFKNCTQSNFFEDEGAKLPYFAAERWGIMGSNYSKNIRYENCRLSRLDAHCGVYNVSLKNCEVVYISVVGGGTLTVEDTIIYNDNVIQLRGDYGSTWKGDIIVKNVMLVNINEPVFFNAGWTNHDYGYKTYLPENIIIDGLEIYRGNTITFFADSFVSKGNIGAEIYCGEPNQNPMVPLGTIVIKNNTQGIEYTLPATEFFSDTKLIFE